MPSPTPAARTRASARSPAARPRPNRSRPRRVGAPAAKAGSPRGPPDDHAPSGRQVRSRPETSATERRRQSVAGSLAGVRQRTPSAVREPGLRRQQAGLGLVARSRPSQPRRSRSGSQAGGTAPEPAGPGGTDSPPSPCRRPRSRRSPPRRRPPRLPAPLPAPSPSRSPPKSRSPPSSLRVAAAAQPGRRSRSRPSSASPR